MTAVHAEQLAPPPLTPSEHQEVEQIVRVARSAHGRDVAAHALIHAMLLYRSYAVRVGVAMIAPSAGINGARLLGITDFIWLGFEPYWKQMIRPMFLAQIAANKVADAKGAIPAMTQLALADDYAARIGMYMNQTSAAAIQDGFNAYVNRRVPVKIAAERAMRSFGLTKRQMASVVNLGAQDAKNSVRPIDTQAPVRSFIERQIRHRFKIVGDQEAFNVSQQALQVNWLYMVENGQLPETAKRVWVTARDEFVCPTCGPMHLKEVGVKEYFIVDGVKMWVPGVHVGCRCTMRLKINTIDVFSKAGIDSSGDWGVEGEEDYDESEHPRDADGKFARKNSVLTRAADTKTSDPLKRQTLARTSLERPLLARTSLERTSLERVATDLTRKLERTTALDRSTDPIARHKQELKRRQKVRVQQLVRQQVDILARAKPKHQPDKVLSENIPLPEPLFAMPDGTYAAMNRNYRDTGVLMDDKTRWGGMSDIHNQLLENHERIVDFGIRTIMEARMNHLPAEIDADGTRWTAIPLDESDVAVVVQEAAIGYPDDDQYIDVTWRSNEGEYIRRREPIHKLGEMMSLDPDEYVQRVYMAIEFPSTAENLGSETKRGMEDWRAPGHYNADLHSMERTEHGGVPIEIVEIWPMED